MEKTVEISMKHGDQHRSDRNFFLRVIIRGFTQKNSSTMFRQNSSSISDYFV